MDGFYREAYRLGVYFRRECNDPACSNCLTIGAPKEPPEWLKADAKFLRAEIAFLLHIEPAGHA